MAILMMFLRWGVEKFIFRPIGLQVGMKDSRKSYPRSNSVLEAEFRKSKNPTQAATENLSKATSMSQLEVIQGDKTPSVEVSHLVFRSRDGSDKGSLPSYLQLYRSSAKQAGGNPFSPLLAFRHRFGGYNIHGFWCLQVSSSAYLGSKIITD